jgi:type VI secretion system secreted protein Hcp
MEEVIVSSVSTGGSGGEDRLTENITINFAKVKVDYKEQTEKGGVGATPKMGWDIEANKKI